MCVYIGYKCSIDLICCYVRSMNMCVESLSSAHHSAITYIISFAVLNTSRGMDAYWTPFYRRKITGSREQENLIF